MPEPDFDQIAESMVDDPDGHLARVQMIAEQLRLVWNARGAADIAELPIGNGATVKSIRSLDR